MDDQEQIEANPTLNILKRLNRMEKKLDEVLYELGIIDAENQYVSRDIRDEQAQEEEVEEEPPRPNPADKILRPQRDEEPLEL